MGQFTNVMLLILITAAMTAITIVLAFLFDGIPSIRGETAVPSNSVVGNFIRSALTAVHATAT